MLHSYYKPLVPVTLPFAERQRYMHSFDLARPVMAEGFEDYLPIVESLCAAAGYTTGEAHMTVDEKVIAAGMSQRRPGPHVDGHFMKAAEAWGHWQHPPTWLHHCNKVPIPRMPVIVASSVAGCRVFEGTFIGEPKNDGDLSHLPNLGGGVLLPAEFGFWLSPDCVHESVRFAIETKRTFLRIALPPSPSRT